MAKNIKWTIIGGGNGGQSLAGHLAIMGFKVRLYDIVQATVDAINSQGGVQVSGAVNGFGALEFATMEISRAIKNADVLMVVAPSTAHRAIATNIAPVLEDGQVVIVHPGSTCGALEFRHVLNMAGCKAKISIAETSSLIYACRSIAPGHAHIHGIKKDLVMSTMPIRENPRVLAMIQEAFPQICGGRNVLETSFANANPVVHPAPSLLNTSMIESKHEWLYYYEGITPSIGAFVEDLDRERVQVAKSFGIDVLPIVDWFRVSYGLEASTLTEAVRKNPAYDGIKGQKTLRSRYLLEDIPNGLVPLIELGKMQNIDMPRTDIVIRLGQYLLKEDFYANGRTLINLGLQNMTSKQLVHYAETGEK